MPQQVKKSLVISIYFALLISTLLVFWQVRNFDFVNFDDPAYVTKNLDIQTGITHQSVKWALATGYYGNWNPLTWLSYMLDWQLFGSNPAGFHLTNLIFHILNTLLLFFVLKQMTNAIWQSAFVAALFALHPLHVEAVGWISCRKDVLSTFLWLLTMAAYIRYVKQPSISRYLQVLLIFVMGIMAKPMLVTLPFVLLLLDYWPLDRIGRFQLRTLYRLILEKIPFIILTAVCSVIAVSTQRSMGGLVKFTELGLNFRIYNVLISYVKYIEKMFWPSHLAAFYPHPYENVSVLYAVISAAVLLIITILVLRFAKNHRYLATGWFWYLGTLIPVIGIIQVGSHAYADRYTYITLTGLFIIIAWGLTELLAKWLSASPQRKITLGLSMAIVLTTLGICAHRQTSYWKNSVTLFSHTIEVTQNNCVAYNNLGLAYDALGCYPEAMEDFSQAIRIKPDYAEAYTNLGTVYARLGRYQEAIDVHKQAIKFKPGLAMAHYNLGNAYAKLGRGTEAIEAYKQAIKIQPDDAVAHYNLGNACYALGRYPEAINVFEQAIRIKPDYAEAYYNLGITYYALRRFTEAIDAYKQAIRIKPDYAEAHNNLGLTYDDLGRFTEAIDAYKQAIRIKPDNAEAHYNLGIAYLAIGDKNSALAEYNILKTINPQIADNLYKEINK
jgi:tetratricopeptide (TPR) repeat protein